MGAWRRFKFFIPAIVDQTDYIYAKSFNYYESPYPDIMEIHKCEKKIFDRDKEVRDIDLNIDRQLELIKAIEYISLPKWPMK